MTGLSIISRALVSWVSLSIIVVAACGGGTTTGSAHDSGADGRTDARQGDARADAGKDSGGTAMDGGGLCCPIAPGDVCNACGGGGGGGGWAAKASECPSAPCDGTLARATDSHGCPYIASGGGAVNGECCRCPLVDAGRPPSLDAAVD